MKPNKNYLEERRNNKKYWAKRAIEKAERFIEEAEKVAMELETGYLESARIITQEIRRIFSAFENAFDLSQAEAKRLIARAGDKPPSKAIMQILNEITDPEKRLALEAKISAPAYKYRLDRLDKLDKQAKDLCKGLYGLEYRTDSVFLASEMEKAYNYTIFDLQQGTGISGAFDVLPKSKIEQVLKTNWRGKHFSSRIWGNTQQLADELRQSMIQSFITGESSRKAAVRIQERFNVGAYEARRLIRTEHTYVCGQAELEAYKMSGVDKYEYASLIDDRTSLICNRLDGKIYEVAKAKPGVNYPPMHPFCRSSTMAVLPTEEELNKEWDTFKADNVPQDMTFDEWLDRLEPTEDGKLVFKQKTVDISGESGISETAKSDFVPAKNIKEAQEYAEKLGVDADYSKFDISVANAVNETMQRAIDEFGDHALTALKTIGKDTSDKRRAGGFDYFTGNLSLSGTRGKNALQKMGEKTRKANQMYDDMMYFSANGDLQTIHHEIGHAIHSSLGGSVDTASTALDKDIILFMKDKRSNVFSDVSYYATTKHEELVAECIAQYFDGAPSDIAKGVVEILKKYSN